MNYVVDTRIYTREALFRACYRFTDRCYVFLRTQGQDAVLVEFRGKTSTGDLSQLLGEFANELIDQQVRADIALETKGVRTLIVSQAFAEARFDESGT